jgi:CO/xanthine dehydrogenase Mo-binding subunit
VFSYVGAPLRRKEDAKLLRGEGRYAGDVRLVGMLHAAVVRSPHAHARLLGVDAAAALAVQGVVAVLSAADLPADLAPIPLRLTSYPGLTDALQYPLARDKVRYVGDPVAVVVAEDRYRAEDGADAVAVQYERLPPLTSVAAALAEGAPVLHEALGHNVACRFEQRVGDAAAALQAADLVIQERFATNRQAGVPLECRGLLAEYDAGSGRLTVWGAAKVPHFNRATLARLLGLAESRLRLVENEVGGGFGARGEFYPEDYLIPYLALRLGRPIGWTEDRREHLMAINHSRQQEFHVRVGVRRDGTILGLHARIDNDHGGYVRTHGATVPELGSALLPGPYRIPHYLAEVRCVLTNKTPTGTYRGPGRYEGTFVRERLVDIIAHRLHLDPADVRRRNLITPAEMPYDVGTGGLAVHTIYDTGDYPALLDAALTALDYAGFRREQAATRAAGQREQAAEPAAGEPEQATEPAANERGPAPPRLRGAGIGAYVEKSGLGPWEYACVEVGTDGRVLLYTGGSSVGQGMATILSQIVADALGVHPDQVDVVYGDTDRVRYGAGAFASRVTVVGGAAAHEAARQVRLKAVAVAAGLLEVAPEDLEVVDGQVCAKDAPSRLVGLAEVASACLPSRVPDGAEPGLRAEHFFRTEHMTYPGGVHACIVSVDAETGHVRLEKYAIAYDVGRAVNPLLVAGQLQGGLAQGVGGALLESLVYGEDGQLLSGTFMDYLLPTSEDVPEPRLAILETTPTPLTPLGTKGAGEGGTTGAGGCIANAIADALAPLGAEVTRLPLSPAAVRGLIDAASREGEY